MTPTRGAVLTAMDWEAGVLGRRFARVTGIGTLEGAEAAAALQALRQEARQNAFELLFARVHAGQSGAVHALQRAGWVHAATGIRFSMNVRAALAADGNRAGSIRPVRAEDAPALQRIGRGAFRHGPYHAAPFFTQTEGDRLFDAWLVNCLAGERAQAMFTAEHDSKLAGFCALRAVDGGPDIIELIAVGAEARGHGLGRALLCAMLHWRHASGGGVVEARTHITNLPALNLFAGVGGRIVECDMTFILALAEAAS